MSKLKSSKEYCMPCIKVKWTCKKNTRFACITYDSYPEWGSTELGLPHSYPQRLSDITGEKNMLGGEQRSRASAEESEATLCNSDNMFSKYLIVGFTKTEGICCATFIYATINACSMAQTH